MMIASSPSSSSSPGGESERVFLKVTSTTDDEMSCTVLMTCTEEGKVSGSEGRSWLGEPAAVGLIGGGDDCGDVSALDVPSSARTSTFSESEPEPEPESETSSSSRGANGLTKSNASHESETEARDDVLAGWWHGTS